MQASTATQILLSHIRPVKIFLQGLVIENLLSHPSISPKIRTILHSRVFIVCLRRRHREYLLWYGGPSCPLMALLQTRNDLYEVFETS